MTANNREKRSATTPKSSGKMKFFKAKSKGRRCYESVGKYTDQGTDKNSPLGNGGRAGGKENEHHSRGCTVASGLFM